MSTSWRATRSAALEHAADATIWPRVFGNCHLGRDTRASIERAGFQIECCERLRLTEADFPHPHILGQAVRPL
jgi:hypothetical protein